MIITYEPGYHGEFYWWEYSQYDYAIEVTHQDEPSACLWIVPGTVDPMEG